MKIKVEYSESIQIAEGLWRKIGVEIEDGDDENGRIHDAEKYSQTLHNQAKEYVQRWHKEDQMTTKSWLEPIVSQPITEMQVDRPLSNTIEALIKDIQSCNDIKILESYKLLARQKPDLQSVYQSKLEELTK